MCAHRVVIALALILLGVSAVAAQSTGVREVSASDRSLIQLTTKVRYTTCEMGTAEYNLALGERRASAVRDYLVSRGIAAERLQTASYGEERLKHDISTESTRALNRRAEMHPVLTTSPSR